MILWRNVEMSLSFLLQTNTKHLTKVATFFRHYQKCTSLIHTFFHSSSAKFISHLIIFVFLPFKTSHFSNKIASRCYRFVFVSIFFVHINQQTIGMRCKTILCMSCYILCRPNQFNLIILGWIFLVAQM